MTLAPLLEAPVAIQIHVAAMSSVVLLTPVQWLLPKGTPLHRATGRTWVALIVMACLSSFFVHTIRTVGPFSPIHLLSVTTLAAVVLAVVAARRGDVTRHRRGMGLVVLGGLVVAGGFTLLPGRLMHEVVFGHGVATVGERTIQPIEIHRENTR